MKDLVPGTLQRLRAADIIRMAGLNAASLGQEYARAGAVHETKRQGAKLSGFVEIPRSSTNLLSEPDEDPDVSEPRRFVVDVEVQGTGSWTSNCSCNARTSLLCAHAAALLYRWLSHFAEFEMPQLVAEATTTRPARITVPIQQTEASTAEEEEAETVKAVTPTVPSKPLNMPGDANATWNLLDILTQLGLSELRSIAREYDITMNGIGKQQIATMLADALRKPEAIRRVATTLEKSQRQLLAAVTLAGGLVTDDDLHGLFERFALGQSSQLQQVLATLQGKALLFRTSMNTTSTHGSGLGSSLLNIGWYVPLEVRTALRVTVPTTVFNTEQELSAQEGKPRVHLAEPYSLLADLLLVARTLDGRVDDENDERLPAMRSTDTPAFPRVGGTQSSDGSVAIPQPADLPSPALLDLVREHVPRSPERLRFAIRLLRLADILHKDDSGTPQLRALPNVAQLFLGANRAEVAKDLFALWLTQSSYTELYDLHEDGLRLRCRATALSFPVLRSGELDAENRDARQALLNLLVQVPLNQWVNFPAYARFVYRLNPLFLQRKQRQFSTPHWWIEHEMGRPLRPQQLNDWLRAESHYLARLLEGPLHWWGACDIAKAPDGRLLAFRLTPTAGWLFGNQMQVFKTDLPEALAASGALEILDHDAVLVNGDVQSWPIIELMERFAEAIGVRQGRLHYRLTPAALSEALRHGSRPAELLNVLHTVSAHATQSASRALLERLERWIESYGRVRIYTGVTLLETVDTVVMRELTATTNVNEQIVQSINSTLHVLKKSGSEQIIDELKRRGQSPLLHDGDVYGAE